MVFKAYIVGTVSYTTPSKLQLSAFCPLSYVNLQFETMHMCYSPGKVSPEVNYDP